MNSPEGPDLASNLTGYDRLYNLLYSDLAAHIGNDYEYAKRYINLNQTKKAIHAGVYDTSDDSYDKLVADVIKTVEPNFTALIDKYKVMLYVGNMDTIVGVDRVNGMLENPG